MALTSPITAPLRAVLVTGASGFVGSHVVRALLDGGYAQEVRCLTRAATPALLELEQSSGGRVKLCIGDLAGPSCRQSVLPHLAGCEGVIHCAAHYRWWTRSPGTFRELNDTAAGELVKMAAEAGVRRFVQVSTILAMGTPGGGWGSATRPLLPHTPPGPAASRYAASKAAGDAAVLRHAAAAVALTAAAAVALTAAADEGPSGTGRGAAGLEAVVGTTRQGQADETGQGEGEGAQREVEARAGGGGVGAGRGGMRACVVALGCVVGADRRLVGGGEEDVMRIADLVRGKVPATLGHDTTFTYIGVRDAADAIVAALLRGEAGQRYLVGNQRLTTAEYYDVIARLSGTPAPTQRVPVWLAAGWAAATAGWAALTGVPPQAPPDLIRTVAYGTLLYDSSSSEADLGLTVPYRDISESFREAVQYVQQYDAVRRGEAEASD